MAVIPVAQAVKLYDDNNKGERVVLYVVFNVDSGDTLDVAAEFKEVKLACFVPAGDLAVVGTVSPSGSTLTLTDSGMADDNVFLLCIGQSKQP